VCARARMCVLIMWVGPSTAASGALLACMLRAAHSPLVWLPALVSLHSAGLHTHLLAHALALPLTPPETLPLTTTGETAQRWVVHACTACLASRSPLMFLESASRNPHPYSRVQILRHHTQTCTTWCIQHLPSLIHALFVKT